MKFLVVFAALLAASSAAPSGAYLTHGFGEIVEGPKTIIAGPSGTISADTGSIIKSPISTGFIAPVAPRLIAPLAPRLIAPAAPLFAPAAPLFAPRLIAPAAPLIAPRLIAPTAPLIAPFAPRVIDPFLGAPLLDRGLYAPGFLGTRSLLSGW